MRHRPLVASFLTFATLCACVATPSRTPIHATFRGTASWEAHLARPHATYERTVTLTLQDDGTAARLELQNDAPAGRPASSPLAIVRDADGACWLREPGAPRFRRDRGDGERLLAVALAAATAGPTDPPATAASWAFQHPRLGDIVDRAVWREADGAPQLTIAWHRADTAATFELRPHAEATSAAAAPSSIVRSDDARDPTPVARTPQPARFRTLAAGVHEVVVPDADSRALVVEFEDHVVLCETTLDNDAGERLLAALAAHLPTKPVRHVLFGHYHPHYTGGLRPVMARGATVVAPPLGAAFAREIAARPFTNPPDALARSGHNVAVEEFRGERRFADATNELVAIDIGQDSDHTDEYVVFWLPRQRLLFEGDLGWFAGERGLQSGGSRAHGLLRAIDARQLPVATLVQGWPALTTGTLPIEQFRALLAK